MKHRKLDLVFLVFALLLASSIPSSACSVNLKALEFQLGGSDDPSSEQDLRDRIRQRSVEMKSGIKAIESRGGCSDLIVIFRFREKRFSVWPRNPRLLAAKGVALLREVSKENETNQTKILRSALVAWLSGEGWKKEAEKNRQKKTSTWEIPCAAQSCLLDVSRPRELRLTLVN